MSVTPTSTARRRTIGRVVAATGVAAVAAAGSLLFANTAGATARLTACSHATTEPSEIETPKRSRRISATVRVLER